MNELGIFGLRLFAKARLGFFGPITEDFLTQLANLLDGASFCFVRRATFAHRLIDQIRNHEQTPAQVRPSGEAFIEAWFVFTLIGMV